MKENNFKGQITVTHMKEKISKIDKKILYILSRNARISDTTIAKKLKTTREVVAYHLKQLKQKNIINGFFTNIDPRKLGYVIYAAYLKLKNINNGKKILGYLIIHQEVTILKSCSGRYDISFEVAVDHIDQFEVFFSTFLHHFFDSIESYDIFTCLDAEYVGRGFLITNAAERKELDAIKEHKGSSFQEAFALQKKNTTLINIDELDKKLLDLLQFNAKLSVIELSSAAGAAPKTIVKHLKELVVTGVIRRFLPLINFSSFGLQWYIFFLQLNNLDEKKFITFISMHPHILHYTKYIGKWNYKINIFVENNYQFYEIVDQLRDQFSENIASFDSVMVYNQFKFVQRI